MDHIFGDSHDIAFGATPARSPYIPATPTDEPRARTMRTDDFGDLDAPGTLRPQVRTTTPRPVSPRPAPDWPAASVDPGRSRVARHDSAEAASAGF